MISRAATFLCKLLISSLLIIFDSTFLFSVSVSGFSPGLLLSWFQTAFHQVLSSGFLVFFLSILLLIFAVHLAAASSLNLTFSGVLIIIFSLSAFVWCVTFPVKDGIGFDPPLCSETSQGKYGSCAKGLECVGENVGKMGEVGERELVRVVSVRCGEERDMARG